jgi:hypothetical protein
MATQGWRALSRVPGTNTCRASLVASAADVTPDNGARAADGGDDGAG